MSLTSIATRTQTEEAGAGGLSPDGVDVELTSSPGLLRLWSRRMVLFVASLAVAVTALATIGPRIVPLYRVYSVRSGSMEPAIPIGAMIVLRPVPAERLRVGDIITFRRTGPRDGFVTHRIAAIEDGPQGRAFVTKGDANATVDDWVVPAQGRGWRYAFGIPYLGYVFGAPASWGRLVLLVISVAVLGGWVLVAIWRRPSPSGQRLAA